MDLLLHAVALHSDTVVSSWHFLWSLPQVEWPLISGRMRFRLIYVCFSLAVIAAYFEWLYDDTDSLLPGTILPDTLLACAVSLYLTLPASSDVNPLFEDSFLRGFIILQGVALASH